MVTKPGPLCKVKLLKNGRDKLGVRSPVKAGVGGSTPSLATIITSYIINDIQLACFSCAAGVLYFHVSRSKPNPAKSIGVVVNLILYRRHKQACEHKGDPTYKRCHCPVWFQKNQDGKQERWTSKETTWEGAQRLARHLEKQDEDARYGRTVPGAAKTVKETVELFLAAKRGENLSPDTIYRHEQITKVLLDF